MTRSNAPGWDQFWEHYDNGTWEPDTKKFLERLNPGDLFVDIGAWIGPVTLWALELGAYVIAVEPDPAALICLWENAEEWIDQLEVWPGACAPYNGVICLDRSSGDSQTRVGEMFNGPKVEAWTLEEILDGRIPDLVKMDVEGYETILAPAIMPMLSDYTVPIQISLHGTHLDESIFPGYTVDWPAESYGDLRAY